MRSTVAAPPIRLTDAARKARVRDAAAVAGMLGFLAITNPDRPLPFDVCLWHRLTGHDCLTCGLTRAVCHAIRGDWAGSVAYHPAGILVLFLLAAWVVRSTLEAARGEALRPA